MKSLGPRLNSNSLRDATARIISQVFDYHRVGHDQRWMTFLPGGLVGQGARGKEVFWELHQRKSETVLLILGETGITCQLKEGEDKVWRGQWQAYERMPIELVPVALLTGSFTDSVRPALPEGSMSGSLFVVSLPRSLSSIVYEHARRAVRLDQPTWTSSGEVLNIDRFSLFDGATNDTGHKYVERAAMPSLYHAAVEFLDQLVMPMGFAYKDVVQPFVVAHWLKQNPMRTLRIKRNIADVALSMLNRNWLYPARLFRENKKPELALIQGLICADQALDSISAEIIDFDQLTTDEAPINTAMKNLYGRKFIGPLKFIDEKFKAMSRQIREHRKTRKHRVLSDYVKQASEAKTNRSVAKGFL